MNPEHTPDGSVRTSRDGAVLTVTLDRRGPALLRGPGLQPVRPAVGSDGDFGDSGCRELAGGR